MATSTLNIRIDADLKREMEEVSSEIGLTPTAVFNVFARQFVAHRGFPFAVVAPVPTEREFAERMDSIDRRDPRRSSSESCRVHGQGVDRNS